MTKTFEFVLYFLVFITTFNYATTLSSGTYIVSDLGGDGELSPYGVAFFALGNVCTYGLGHHFCKKFGKIQVIFITHILFTLSIFLCAIASDYPSFILFRFFSGCAGAVLYQSTWALINENKTDEQKVTAASYLSLILVLGPTFGGAYGACVAYEWKWSWIFYSQLPLLITSFVVVWNYRKPFANEKSIPFDWTGYAFFTLSVISLTTALSLGQQLDWFRSPLICSLFVVFIITFGFFLIWELKIENHFMRIRLCKIFLFCVSVISMFVLYSGYYGVLSLLSLWLHLEVSYTPIWIAIVILSMSLAAVLFFLLFHFKEKQAVSLTSVRLAITFFAISAFYSTTFNSEINFARLLITHTITGFGIAFSLAPLLFSTISALDPADRDHGTAIFQSVRFLGGGIGAVIYPTIWWRRKVFYHERLGESLTASSELTQQTLEQTAFYGPTGVKAELFLNKALQTQSSALGLADCFYLIGWIMLAIFLLQICYLAFKKIREKKSKQLVKPSQG